LFNNSMNMDATSDAHTLLANNTAQVNIGHLSTHSCVGESINKTEGQQVNCCSGCETQYYSLNGNLVFNYALPDFTKNDISPILMASNVSSSFHQTASRDKDYFWFNQCMDPRVQNVFGIAQSDEMKSQQMCKALAYDWGQYFTPYECNTWFCNNQGTCSISTNNTFQSAGVPTCACAGGYRGKNCMFPLHDYEFLDKYMGGLDSWVGNFTQIRDPETFNAFILMVQHILPFTSNADLADKGRYADTIGKYWNLIGSADYQNITNSLLDTIASFGDNLFDRTDSVQGLDMNATSAMLSRFPNISYNAPKYGFFTNRSSGQGEDIILGGDTIFHPISNVIINNTNQSNVTIMDNATGTTPTPTTANPNPNVTIAILNGTNDTVQTVTVNLPNNTNVTVLSNGTVSGGRRFLNQRITQQLDVPSPGVASPTVGASPDNTTTTTTTTTPPPADNTTTSNTTTTITPPPVDNTTTPNITTTITPPPADNTTTTNTTTTTTIVNTTTANNTTQPSANANGTTPITNVTIVNGTQPTANNTVVSTNVTDNTTNVTIVEGAQPTNNVTVVPNITTPAVNVTIVNATTTPASGLQTPLISLLEGRRNPKVTIPAGAMQQLPNNTVFGFLFVRNPLAFINQNQSFIYSQIVKIFAFEDYSSLPNIDFSNQTNNTFGLHTAGPNEAQNNAHLTVLFNNSNGTLEDITHSDGTTIIKSDGKSTIILNNTNDTNITIVIQGENLTINQAALRGGSQGFWDLLDYPSGVDNYTTVIPWTYTPFFVNGSYNESCKVYSYDGWQWTQANGCIVDSSTDKDNAVIKCNSFGTFGVNCNTQPLNVTQNGTFSVGTTGEAVGTLRTVKHNDGRFISVFSLFLSVIGAMIL
jgi:hypothetical protein